MLFFYLLNKNNTARQMECLCFHVAESPKQTSVAAKRKLVSRSTPVGEMGLKSQRFSRVCVWVKTSTACRQIKAERPSLRAFSPLSVVQRGVRCDLSRSAKPQLSSVRRRVAVQQTAGMNKNTSLFQTSIKQDAGFWYRCHFGLVYLRLFFFFPPLWLCSVLLMNAAGDFRGLPVTSALLPF